MGGWRGGEALEGGRICAGALGGYSSRVGVSWKGGGRSRLAVVVQCSWVYFHIDLTLKTEPVW